MKCSRCDHEATYENEGGLCDEHWARWWSEEQGYSEEERQRVYEEVRAAQREETLNNLRADLKRTKPEKLRALQQAHAKKSTKKEH